MRKSLVTLDTDHIKGYVFATGKLREIRGASSRLDRLNRDIMEEEAQKLDKEACLIYTNGGSGLFLIESSQAETFGLRVQQRYQQITAGGASMTFVVQELPEDAPDDCEQLLKYPLKETLALMRYRLREEKDSPPALLALPSHPLMRTCDACGIFYAEEKGGPGIQTPDESQDIYCTSCYNKRLEDKTVKDYLDSILPRPKGTTYHRIPAGFKSPLWEKVIKQLSQMKYPLPPGVDRPSDFNVFREFRGSKEYLGLIYADANGMGQKIEDLCTLQEVKDFAEETDRAIIDIVCEAIATHLRVGQHIKQDDATDTTAPLFPFDILMMGGDDIVIVTPSSVALQVAHALAKKFYQKEKTPEQSERSLSIGVILAPVNYPFMLLLDLAEETLKFAKKDGAKSQVSNKKDGAKTQVLKESDYGKTRINFLVVTGSTSQNFDSVYGTLHEKDRRKKKLPSQNSDSVGTLPKKEGNKKRPSFYATMRPYTVEQLEFLLGALQKGNKLALGRTKLHQLREAILQKNLTTSVVDGLAVLRNWKPEQREFVLEQVYTFNKKDQLYQWDPDKPAALFPRVSFPWFADGKENGVDIYRTVLLDFVELYDFIAREEESNDRT